jgi:hypothetical protein
MNAPELYKLNLKTAADDRTELIEYCLEHNVLGVGWGPHYFLDDGDPLPPTFEAYLAAAEDAWSSREMSSVRSLHAAEPGSLIWFRDLGGNYYLARITGEWRLLTGPDAERIDLANVREVDYKLVGSAAEVPGGVLRGYAAPRQRAFSRVGDWASQIYTALLASELFGTLPPGFHLSANDVLESLLGPLDVEDLVAAYLQDTRNYIALPARYSKSTPAYEYVLRSRTDGHQAVVQVKTGSALVPLDRIDRETADKWFVYVAAAQRLPAWVDRVTAPELVDYLESRPAALPPVAERWIRFINGHRVATDAG